MAKWLNCSVLQNYYHLKFVFFQTQMSMHSLEIYVQVQLKVVCKCELEGKLIMF